MKKRINLPKLDVKAFRKKIAGRLKFNFPTFKFPDKPKHKIFLSGSSVFFAIIIIIFAVSLSIFGKPKTITTPITDVLKKKIELFSPADLKLAKIPTKKSGVKDPIINAKNSILIDVNSGYMMFGINELEPVPIASLTKLMTALLTIEDQPLDKVVTVPKHPTEVNGSKILLKQGESITVENLLYALLMNSANDAAYTLASISDTEEAFVAKMNKRATDLGLTATLFKDPAGLDDEGRSSAKDIGLLAAYVYRNPVLSKIAKTKETTIKSTDGKLEHKLDNSDRLVKDELYTDGVIGGKTGFTPTSGHNLAAVADRNGHKIVAVVINTYENTPSASAKEAKKLIEWGFGSNDWLEVKPDSPQ